MRKKQHQYEAIIVQRSINRYCVHIPRKIINNQEFNLGDKVLVNIKEVEKNEL